MKITDNRDSKKKKLTFDEIELGTVFEWVDDNDVCVKIADYEEEFNYFSFEDNKSYDAVCADKEVNILNASLLIEN